jgi:flotillin
VVNGAEGINEVLVGLVGQGLSILDTLKKSTSRLNGSVAANGLVAVPAAGER